MTDAPMGDRHSEAALPELVTDPDDKAKREARNGLRQFDRALETIQYWVSTEHPPGRPFRLRPSLVYELQRFAVEGITAFAGVTRPAGIEIKGSKHVPPPAGGVASLLEDLCDYVNEHWEDRSALHLAAYCLWRLNWIHPFVDGNGRTSRMLSYVVLSVRLGYRLPGSPTIPEMIANQKTPYYNALESADAAWERNETLDISAVEKLIEDHLAAQFLSAVRAAGLQESSGSDVADP